MKREEDIDLLGEVVLAHTYWRKRGLMIDLVIFNQLETSYEQDFKNRSTACWTAPPARIGSITAAASLFSRKTR